METNLSTKIGQMYPVLLDRGWFRNFLSKTTNSIAIKPLIEKTSSIFIDFNIPLLPVKILLLDFLVKKAFKFPI